MDDDHVIGCLDKDTRRAQNALVLVSVAVGMFIDLPWGPSSSYFDKDVIKEW